MDAMTHSFRDEISEIQLLAEDSSFLKLSDELPRGVLATLNDLCEQIVELKGKAEVIRSYQVSVFVLLHQ